VTLAEAADTVHLFAATTFNGDGIITAATAGEDEEARQVITEIIGALGGETDRSGQPGINQAKADAFYTACTACIDWLTRGDSPEVRTLGDATAAAAARWVPCAPRWMIISRALALAAFDERALAALNRSESAYLDLAAQDLSITVEEIAGFPLARVAPDQPLPLVEGVNPAWCAKLAALHRDAVTPVFGADMSCLTVTQWTELKAKVAPYEAWLAAKAGGAVEKLGPDHIKAILAGNTRARVNALLDQDRAVEAEFNAIHGVERLCRYTRDLHSLLRNFVNFFDFYAPHPLATFQAGTLFLDGRSSELCIEVAGPSPLAAMSKAYIAYCDCSRAGSPPKKIAACFTQGDSDYLFVGRNGLFYDREGRDWDAKITAVVDNPISVRQAFFLPYKKFVRLIEEQAAKRAAAAEAKSDAKLAEAATKTADTATSGAATAAAPKKVDVGTVAAIGVAVSGAVGALTLILGYVFGLTIWQYPLVLLGLVAVISGPSMLIAWLKLRQRTLGPILEANGWAINGRIKISVPLGTRLTARAELPAGARRSFDDPYADKESQRRRRLYLVGLLVLLAIGIRIHAVQFNEGRYFWQPAPPPPAVETPAELTPTE
jgi:hypothetical protein